ncbi:hypothetical protein LTR16_006242, partial [Cryomyces antarcticus]
KARRSQGGALRLRQGPGRPALRSGRLRRVGRAPPRRVPAARRARLVRAELPVRADAQRHLLQPVAVPVVAEGNRLPAPLLPPDRLLLLVLPVQPPRRQRGPPPRPHRGRLRAADGAHRAARQEVRRHRLGRHGAGSGGAHDQVLRRRRRARLRAPQLDAVRRAGVRGRRELRRVLQQDGHQQGIRPGSDAIQRLHGPALRRPRHARHARPRPSGRRPAAPARL